MAQITLGNELDEVRLTNISASGIQFESQNAVRINTQVKLLWNDDELGMFAPTMLVVREVHHPDRDKFQYIYGAQYQNLESELKARLIALLKKLRDKDATDALEKIQEASPEYLLEAVTEGVAFLKKVLLDQKTQLPALTKAINRLADYEKKSFQIENEIADVIQKLGAQIFQCHLLLLLVPIIAKQSHLKTVYFQTIMSVLKVIRETEQEIKDSFDKIQKLEGSDKHKEVLKRRIEESKNRIFYSKQELLQSVVDTFKGLDEQNPEFKESLKVITSEYEDTLEVTRSSSFDLSNWAITKRNKDQKLRDTDIIVDNRRPSSPTVSPMLVFILGFVSLIAVISIFFKQWFE